MTIEQIIAPGTAKHYLIANSDGKEWLFDSEALRVSMMLYQPSGWRGIMLKKLLPTLHKVKSVRDKLHINTIDCKLKDNLAKILPEGSDFALFSGTPCVHQKLTMQLSRDKRILCYAKLTESPEISKLFEHESIVLNRLSEAGITGIPRITYCGEYDRGLWALVQTTTKTLHSRQVKGWTIQTQDFADRLARQTMTEMAFDTSDFCKSLTALKEHLHWLPDDTCRDITGRALDKVMTELSGTQVSYSAYHGDYTPWNMYIDDHGRLFVFDWEYSSLSHPPGLDRYHYYTQTALYEHHLSARDIINDIKRQGWINKQKYIYYLLDIISRFTLREKGNPDKAILNNLYTWNEILKHLTTWTR